MPTLLDGFCGGGGAGMGYRRAGWTVIGVDIQAQPSYPFDFHQGDAIEFIRTTGHLFDLIHVSPPCQRYSHGTVAGHAHKHPDLIGPTRQALLETGRPYVIENVPRAPLLEPVVLCGSMFDLVTIDDDGTLLHLRRHRLFESSLPISAPRPCSHPRGVQWAGSYGGARRDKDEARLVRRGGYVPSREKQAELMGIGWLPEARLHEAIPPAYTHHLGAQLLELVTTQQGGQQ